MQTELL